MQLDRCANLLRLLEGFRQREEPSLRSPRPPRLVRSVLVAFAPQACNDLPLHALVGEYP